MPEVRTAPTKQPPAPALSTSVYSTPSMLIAPQQCYRQQSTRVRGTHVCWLSPSHRRIANPVRAALLGIPAGAGLMVGDGLWQLPVRTPQHL